ncbi:MAG: hypothetical protein EON60_06605 [Alphaproteobacteria bacterium]|nr:MAG: hypothetical protein EON60_06605 [Alphaproteobacteria bacterium]
MTTISALYDTHSDAVAAVRELETAGVSDKDISLVSNSTSSSYEQEVAKDAGTGAGIGAAIGGTGGLLAGLGMLAIPGVGPVVAAGWLAATAVGAAAGAAVGGITGGLVGAMTESGIPEEDAHFYAEGVRRGGTLVSVRVTDDGRANLIKSVLHRHRNVDQTTRARFYQDSGWTSFDESSQPYTRDQIVSERDRWTQ